MSNITRGSGNVISESRAVGGIQAVELDTSGELIVTQGETESLNIEAEDNLLPLLTSTVEAGRLTLGITPNGSFTNTKPLRYLLVVKDLTAIQLNGSGNIRVEDFAAGDELKIENDGSGGITFASLKSDDTTIVLSGSGSLTMASLEAARATLELSGSGNLDLSSLQAEHLTAAVNGHGSVSVGGSVNDQDVSLNGSGSYDGDGLSSRSAVVSTMGSGSAVVQVSDTLKATIAGSGSITYIGSPTVTQQRNGSGKIQQQG